MSSCVIHGEGTGRIETYVFRGNRSGIVGMDEADWILEDAVLMSTGDFNGDGALDWVQDSSLPPMYRATLRYGPIGESSDSLPPPVAKFGGSVSLAYGSAADLNGDGYDDLWALGFYPPAGEDVHALYVFMGGPGW